MSSLSDPRVFFAAERTLNAEEIPRGYRADWAMLVNLVVALLGMLLAGWLLVAAL